MLKIELQASQANRFLSSLMDARLAEFAAKVAAETYVGDIRDWVAAGRAFTSRTGATLQGIGWRSEGSGAVVYANTQTAVFLEHGTGLYGPNHSKYPIRPKDGRKGRRIPLPGGGDLVRRMVMHPGISPRPFFFADLDNRERRMLSAMREAIAEKLAGSV